MGKISDIAKCKKYYEGVTLVERMKECHTTAVSIAIIEDFQICEAYAYGVKRRIKKEKTTADTLFQAGSISKPVFAVGIMVLAERGLLDIEEDIGHYLLEYGIPTYDDQKHKITLKQILSHHAGFNLHGFAGYQQGQKIPTVEQILTGAFPANNLKLKLIKKPETEFQYSGGGYVLAHKIVMDICRQDFCDMMNSLVFLPLRMANSTYSQPLPKEKLAEIAYGYNLHNLQLPGGYHIMPELPAAGLWTTPSDLALLGIEIMKALKSRSTFLEKKAAALLTTQVYKNSPYGVGFAIEQSKKGLLFGHKGANFGYYSSMFFCPEDGSGIVVMLNSDIGMQICDEVTNAFKELFGW